MSVCRYYVRNLHSIFILCNCNNDVQLLGHDAHNAQTNNQTTNTIGLSFSANRSDRNLLFNKSKSPNIDRDQTQYVTPVDLHVLVVVYSGDSTQKKRIGLQEQLQHYIYNTLLMTSWLGFELQRYYSALKT
jgi:hypothetical protein